MATKYLTSTNPAKNYKVVGKIPISTAHEIASAVTKARAAKLAWKELGIKKRIALLRNLYNEFFNRKEDIVRLIIDETGKTVRYARGEFDRHAIDYNWFLENGEKALQDETTFEDEKAVHRIVYEPLGVTAVITPWNHPFGMFVWGVIPNLIAGNTIVFKTSEECPLTGKLIAEIIKSQNFPAGVFNEIYGAGNVGQKLIDQNIDFIWFTGSSAAGKQIYRKAGKKFIKAVMELGGSNPAIMFADARIDEFIEKIYIKRFSACGQACDALKRLLVQDSIFDEVVEKLKNRFEKIVVGEPEDEKSDIASLVAKRQVDLLESQVTDAVNKGAKVIVGGKRPPNLKGAYYLPTLLTGIKPSMRVWNEEVFGPVLTVVPFKDEEEAVSLANNTRYGLGSIVFTQDKNRARRVASRIEAGNVEINSPSHWLTCNPFGGYKESGIGREHGIHGLRELSQVKLISEEK